MKTNWQDRLRYRFDNYMARGTGALICGLGLASLGLIVVAATVVSLVGISPEDGARIGFSEAAWLSLMRTLDAGTMGGDTGWRFRIAMFIVTLGGIFIISTLIGVLTSAIEGRMSELRKGRSRVIERNHTIILGWSSQVYTLLSELAIANENQRDACVVVMADRDKVEMEDDIRAALPRNSKLRIVCRSGNPIDPNDLSLVSLETARSILVVAGESGQPDSETIKTLLAITNSPTRRAEPYHIVAEIREARNLEPVSMIGGSEVEPVLAGDLIARIIAQTCLQSGLSVVYTELLNFEGDEIYFKEEPSLIGKTFHDALFAYPKSAVMGLASSNGSVKLNPPMDTPISAGDQVIAVSADDDTVVPGRDGQPAVQASRIANRASLPLKPINTLVLGWNCRALRIIGELDHYVAPGSEIMLLADRKWDETEKTEFGGGLQNERLHFRSADTTDRRALDDVHPENFDHVIVLAYSDSLDGQAADARTIMTLLHLRDIANHSGRNIPIVSEMLDLRNRNLAEVTQADDFIVSDHLVSLLMAQISETKALNQVFADLFDADGSEIYLKPAGEYVEPGQAVNFYTLLEAAARRGEVALGYRLKKFAHDSKQSYGVVINPLKSEEVTFSEEDRIVVLAEN
ncbi:hypothetical protein LARV_03647 [Longilinea arvoryzae]|uniref:RCK N-terminal domain-containing protein n=1 Tax=Longilinea arvoryzae TaxID=360412 RepID=A0A0S7BDJ2_9CHLR|nr:potassium transporter TrkA [Longilinea arvoryzae]GAP15854.1 hypothetical protein LARV_03647 [Longilinea arvoryzae]